MEFFKFDSLKIVLVLILLLVITFVPGVKDTVQMILEQGENFQPVYINLGDFDLKWNNDFTLPKLTFDENGISVPTIELNLVFIAAILILIFLSAFFPLANFVTALLASIATGYITYHTVEMYKMMRAGGSTSWETAGFCFKILFIIYFVLTIVSCFRLFATMWQDESTDSDNKLFYFTLSTIIGLLFSALAALIITGINWLLLGLGWAGGTYVCFAFVVICTLLTSSYKSEST